MSKLLPLNDEVLNGSRVFGISDDFTTYTTADNWTTVIDTSSTVAASATLIGGVLECTTVGTDNKSSAIKSTGSVFKFASGKPIYFRAIAKITEGNTDDANVFIGLAKIVTVAGMVDNGAGPALSNTCVGFFKVDGGTNWAIAYSGSDGTPTTVTLTAANSLDKVAHASTTATYFNFEIEVDNCTSTAVDITWKIDGVPVYRVGSVALSSPSAMSVLALVKAGGANAEVLSVDRIDCYQLR